VGMAFSNLIGVAIITTTATTLHANGKTNIETSAQAAEALRPLAGVFAETIFALGIIGTGLLAIPVLAGSTAYAIGEGRKWPVGLSRKPKKAVAFYAVLAVSVFLGIGLNFTSRSHQGALLERGRKRCARAPGDGTPDAIGAKTKGDAYFHAAIGYLGHRNASDEIGSEVGRFAQDFLYVLPLGPTLGCGQRFRLQNQQLRRGG
jgi:hypothetical protein